MKQKAILIIALLALVLMMIAPVCAETLTGTLGGSNYSQQAYTLNSNLDAMTGLDGLYVNDIQNTGNLVTITVKTVGKLVTDANAPPGSTTQFTVYELTNWPGGGGVRVSQVPVGTGTMGYQKIFSMANPPVEENYGYLWLVFNYWNITGRSGDVYMELNYTKSNLYNVSVESQRSGSTGGVGAGLFGWSSSTTNKVLMGDYTVNKQYIISGIYSATKPSGLGISGNITKTGTSFIYIENAANQILASDSVAGSNTLNFSVASEQIYIKMFDTLGTWYNSSLLFAAAAPTVTPTPVPTILAGYVRNTFVTIDGTTYATIHGSNIMLYDVEAAVWSNSTADADGSFYIDTLPYHTINAYATYTAYADHYGDASIMGAETGYSGMDFPIYMYPPGLSPGAGNINLYITVVDAATTYALGSARVQIELPTGAIDGTSTGSDGEAAIFVVPNNTTIKARVQKVGYGDAQESFNSGEVSPKTVTIRLSRGIVTAAPTLTPVPGGTVPTTIDPNDPGRNGGNTGPKAQEMMNFLANNGMQLIQLCFLVTILALLGVKLGGK